MKNKDRKDGQQGKFMVIEGGKQTPSTQRIGWNSWRNVAGGRNLLLETLVRAANAKGQQLSALAQALGVTYGYIAQLRTGHRHTGNISEKFVQACSRYLNVPAITVKLLAGRVGPQDFVLPGELEATRIDQGLQHLSEDPLLGGFVPASLGEQPDDVKLFILTLYQEVSGCELFGYTRIPAVIEAAIRGASLLANTSLPGVGEATPGDVSKDTKE
jgi:transcriptional regulator with XRE-family HTH domain